MALVMVSVLAMWGAVILVLVGVLAGLVAVAAWELARTVRARAAQARTARARAGVATASWPTGAGRSRERRRPTGSPFVPGHA